MIAQAPGSAMRRRAPALRFLLVCVGGWVALRGVASWFPSADAPPDAARPPWGPPSPFAMAAASVASPFEQPRSSTSMAAVEGNARRTPRTREVAERGDDVSGSIGGGGFGSDRHGLRLAWIAHFLPASRAYLPAGTSGWTPVPAAARADPGGGAPFWMHRDMSGWSLSGWAYLRGGDARAPVGSGAGSQLGGGQAALRLMRGFGATGRLRAYGRASIAIDRPRQRELALGFAFAPAARWPVDIAVERRIALGAEGRDAFAAMVTGGVGDIALPAGFRVEAYGQAGVVGARSRDAFADGAVVVDRPLGADDRTPFRLGGLAAGAVQPGAARFDVGPRLTLRLPDVGEGGRIALDWRQRIAGDARPESGVALTLAADF